MGKYPEVREFLLAQPDLERGSGATQNELAELALRWGGTLPSDYEAFLCEFGWASFASVEIPGIGLSVPEHMRVLMVAQNFWNLGLPEELLVVYDPHSDWVYCLSRLHNNRVVVWSYEFGDKQPYDEQYASWSDWFMQYIARADAQ